MRPKSRRPKTKRGPWSPDLVAVGPWCASQAALVPPSTPHPHTAVSHMRGAAGAPAAAPAGAERWGRCYAGHCAVPVSHSRSLIWLCRCLAVWRRARSWHAAGGAADRPGIDTAPGRCRYPHWPWLWGFMLPRNHKSRAGNSTPSPAMAIGGAGGSGARHPRQEEAQRQGGRLASGFAPWIFGF